ncbi:MULTISPECIES: response regulator transcription factor [Tsukamurella]|uniref:Response regulator transcription factor n=1 Tax=Tsukamurella strandjordii TaxID=147577 RepID=A0AA90N7X2_9ACTN|nr:MULTISPECIES: response regulator transcription factor [Tsukamurella]MDP0396460.1 response regulator transcription factor [Tsukamurella strandjordii]GIZ96263.1 DNA-binding response regulator [Tsukamurella sp. TY48]
MRIVVAEDSVLLAEGLQRIIERAGHEVIGLLGDADALRAVDTGTVDLVVTDVRMPPGHGDDGLRAALELRSARTELPVLVLSQYVAAAYARRLLDTGGAVGYLLKERVGRVGDFVRALDTVAAGGVVVDPEVVQKMFTTTVLDRLTPREGEVLGLMAEGRSNAEIGAALVVSDAAVAKHVANIFAKLDLPPEEGNRRVRAILTYLAER